MAPLEMQAKLAGVGWSYVIIMANSFLVLAISFLMSEMLNVQNFWRVNVRFRWRLSAR
jgi:hypothetical protein